MTSGRDYARSMMKVAISKGLAERARERAAADVKLLDTYAGDSPGGHARARRLRQLQNFENRADEGMEADVLVRRGRHMGTARTTRDAVDSARHNYAKLNYLKHTDPEYHAYIKGNNFPQVAHNIMDRQAEETYEILKRHGTSYRLDHEIEGIHDGHQLRQAAGFARAKGETHLAEHLDNVYEEGFGRLAREHGAMRRYNLHPSENLSGRRPHLFKEVWKKSLPNPDGESHAGQNFEHAEDFLQKKPTTPAPVQPKVPAFDPALHSAHRKPDALPGAPQTPPTPPGSLRPPSEYTKGPAAVPPRAQGVTNHAENLKQHAPSPHVPPVPKPAAATQTAGAAASHGLFRPRNLGIAGGAALLGLGAYALHRRNQAKKREEAAANEARQDAAKAPARR